MAERLGQTHAPANFKTRLFLHESLPEDLPGSGLHVQQVNTGGQTACINGPIGQGCRPPRPSMKAAERTGFFEPVPITEAAGLGYRRRPVSSEPSFSTAMARL